MRSRISFTGTCYLVLGKSELYFVSVYSVNLVAFEGANSLNRLKERLFTSVVVIRAQALCKKGTNSLKCEIHKHEQELFKLKPSWQRDLKAMQP